MNDDLAEMDKAPLLSLYLLGAYLLLRPEADLPSCDTDFAKRHFGDLDPAAIRAKVLKLIDELETRGIQLWHL